MDASEPVIQPEIDAGDFDHLPPDDRFVPIRVRDLIETIAADRAIFGPDASRIGEIGRAIDRVIEIEASAFERTVVEQYDQFNPDRETIIVRDADAVRTPGEYDELDRTLHYLLRKANFERLTEVQIDDAVRQANSYGLRVRLRPELIQSLSLWVRGRSEETRTRRTMRHPVHGEEEQIDIYRRLVVVSRGCEDDNVCLKLFKDIPLRDLEALLPHAEVTMNLFDRIKLLGGGAGVVGTTAAKILKLVAGALALSRLLWILLIGFGLLMFRSFFGYRTARTLRDSQRTQHLYYQNVANNQSVIVSLITMIWSEEVKEAAIAYAFLQRRSHEMHSTDDLRQEVERWLQERFGVCVRFDVEDALETISRYELWRDEKSLDVVSPAEAIDRLDRVARERLSEDYHLRLAREFVPAPANIRA